MRYTDKFDYNSLTEVEKAFGIIEIEPVEDTESRIYKYRDFVVEIIWANKGKDDEYYEAWLHHENHGASEMMFGRSAHNMQYGEQVYDSYDDFIEMVEKYIYGFIYG